MNRDEWEVVEQIPQKSQLCLASRMPNPDEPDPVLLRPETEWGGGAGQLMAPISMGWELADTLAVRDGVGWDKKSTLHPPLHDTVLSCSKTRAK